MPQPKNGPHGADPAAAGEPRVGLEAEVEIPAPRALLVSVRGVGVASRGSHVVHARLARRQEVRELRVAHLPLIPYRSAGRLGRVMRAVEG